MESHARLCPHPQRCLSVSKPENYQPNETLEHGKSCTNFHRILPVKRAKTWSSSTLMIIISTIIISIVFSPCNGLPHSTENEKNINNELIGGQLVETTQATRDAKRITFEGVIYAPRYNRYENKITWVKPGEIDEVKSKEIKTNKAVETTNGTNTNVTLNEIKQYYFPIDFQYDDFYEVIKNENNGVNFTDINLFDHIVDPTIAHMMNKYLNKETEEINHTESNFVGNIPKLEATQDSDQSVQYVNAVKIPDHLRDEISFIHRDPSQITQRSFEISNNNMQLNNSDEWYQNYYQQRKSHEYTSDHYSLSGNYNNIPLSEHKNKEANNQDSYIKQILSGNARIQQSINYTANYFETAKNLSNSKINSINTLPLLNQNTQQMRNNSNQMVKEITKFRENVSASNPNLQSRPDSILPFIDSLSERQPIQVSRFNIRPDAKASSREITTFRPISQYPKEQNTPINPYISRNSHSISSDRRQLEILNQNLLNAKLSYDTSFPKATVADRGETESNRIRKIVQTLVSSQTKEPHKEAIAGKITIPTHLNTNAIQSSILASGHVPKPDSYKMRRKYIAPTPRGFMPIKSSHSIFKSKIGELSDKLTPPRNDEQLTSESLYSIVKSLVRRNSARASSPVTSTPPLPPATPPPTIVQRQPKSVEYHDTVNHHKDRRPIFQDPRTHPDEIMYYNALEDEIRRSKFLTESVRLVSSDSFRDIIHASLNKGNKKSVLPKTSSANKNKTSRPNPPDRDHIESNEIRLSRGQNTYSSPHVTKEPTFIRTVPPPRLSKHPIRTRYIQKTTSPKHTQNSVPQYIENTSPPRYDPNPVAHEYIPNSVSPNYMPNPMRTEYYPAPVAPKYIQNPAPMQYFETPEYTNYAENPVSPEYIQNYVPREYIETPVATNHPNFVPPKHISYQKHIVAPNQPPMIKDDYIDALYNFKHFNNPNVKYASQENWLNTNIDKYSHFSDNFPQIEVVHAKKRNERLQNSQEMSRERKILNRHRVTERNFNTEDNFDNDFRNIFETSDWRRRDIPVMNIVETFGNHVLNPAQITEKDQYAFNNGNLPSKQKNMEQRRKPKITKAIQLKTPDYLNDNQPTRNNRRTSLAKEQSFRNVKTKTSNDYKRLKNELTLLNAQPNIYNSQIFRNTRPSTFNDGQSFRNVQPPKYKAIANPYSINEDHVRDRKNNSAMRILINHQQYSKRDYPANAVPKDIKVTRTMRTQAPSQRAKSRSSITTYRPKQSHTQDQTDTSFHLPSVLTDYSSIFKDNIHNLNWNDGSYRRRDYHVNDEIIYGQPASVDFLERSSDTYYSAPASSRPLVFTSSPNFDFSTRVGSPGSITTSIPKSVNIQLEEGMKRLQNNKRDKQIPPIDEQTSFVVPTISQKDLAATPSLFNAFFPPS